MSPRHVGRPLLFVLLAAGLLSIMLVGGCPVPQTPGTPTTQVEDEDDDQSASEQPSTDEDQRPVQLPDPGSSGSGNGNGSGNGGGGGGGTTSTEPFVRIDAPFTSQTVAPGTSMDVEVFIAVASNDSIKTGEFVVARDEAPFDQSPDGSGAIVWSTPAGLVTGRNTISYNTANLNTLLANQFGRFLFGIRVTTALGGQKTAWANGTVTLDGAPPVVTWIGAGQSGGVLDQADHLESTEAWWEVQIQTGDNAPTHTVTIQLRDADTGEIESEFGATQMVTAAGSAVRTFTARLTSFTVGTYRYYYIVSDGLTTIEGYAPGRIGITNRIIGPVSLNALDSNLPLASPSNPDGYDPNYADGSSKGFILQGFNFWDYAGTAMTTVPRDLAGNEVDGFLVVSRFAKPYVIGTERVGFGQAYLIYGNAMRDRGTKKLSSVGAGNIPGVTFPGIRVRMNNTHTRGMSDATVLPDIDGDARPELVFSFPRVESLNLGAPAQVAGTAFQHPDLVPDLAGMGELEYDAIDYSTGNWNDNVAQFTRGGIVIVSSQNDLLSDRNVLNRKFDRVIDLHEVGQLFTSMTRSSLKMYVRPISGGDPETFLSGAGTATCDENEVIWEEYTRRWDVVFANDAPPGGFHMPWTDPPADPPLANPSNWTFALPADDTDPCNNNEDGCQVINEWYDWSWTAGGGSCTRAFPLALDPNAAPGQCISASWNTGQDIDGNGADDVAWTGFYSEDSRPYQDPNGGGYSTLGARVLGQAREDHFGVSVSSDSTWLYVSAPFHTATTADLGAQLPADRSKAGVVYMLRVDTQPQLWLDPGQNWPLAKETRIDNSMPLPHQYIVESIGSWRGNVSATGLDYDSDCAGAYNAGTGVPAVAGYAFKPYQIHFHGSGYWMDRTSQIVGPHADAELRFVRAIGDVNADGINDFAVGSERILQTLSLPPGGLNPEVGGVFIIFNQSPQTVGDYLLERIALPATSPNRLEGVFLKGSSAAAKLARVFDGAGDFNGDGINDVIVGSEGSDSSRGEAIVMLGSPTLNSPENGWTVAGIVAAERAVRFTGEAASDLAGANVAGIGDFDGDGIDDIAIAAPGANGTRGRVYVIYGGTDFNGGETFSLANVGTLDLPGAVFSGRAVGDYLGGGVDIVAATAPASSGSAVNTSATSRGVVTIGDIDGNGRPDLSISSILASPEGKTRAGEVYVIYGKEAWGD